MQKFEPPLCCGKHLILISDWRGTYTFQCNKCRHVTIIDVMELKRAHKATSVTGVKK